MKDNPLNIELEKKIEDYLTGKLTAGEIDELWADILREPEYLVHLQTEAQLRAYFRKKKTVKPSGVKLLESRSLLVSMAAVVIFAVGMFWYLSQFQNSILVHPLAEISVADMETPAVTRSDTEAADESVEIILEAYDRMLDDDETIAVSLFRDITMNYPETESATYSWLNLGIVAYNNSEFETASDHFATASQRENVDELVRQKSFWFLANAAYQAGDYNIALSASRQAADMTGYYTTVATDFNDSLTDQLQKE